MTIVHVLEPFATGVTAAVSILTHKLIQFQHIVVHGARTGGETQESIKGKFAPGTIFIEWRHASRELNPIKDFLALCSLASVLKKYRKDSVIHLHSSKAGFLGRAACALLRVTAVVYTPHGASFIRTDIGAGKQKLYRTLEKIAGRFGGVVAGCGEYEAGLYADLGLNALAIPNGIELGRPADGAEKNFIAFSGLVSVQKDPAFFNAAAALVRKERPEANFVWIGDGPLRPLLSSENISVTGWVGKEAVAAKLDETVIFFSPSAWEGLSYGALEAMSASCALLLRDSPGNVELVREGENGYLCHTPEEAAKKIVGMLDDRERTKGQGKKSRLMAEEKYSAQAMASAYKTLYQKLLAGRAA